MRLATRGAIWLGAALMLGFDAPAENGGELAFYRPNRRDYMTFRKAYPDILEPNYLPFMVHRFPGNDAQGDLLAFCRWSEKSMPIPVAIVPPTISESLQSLLTHKPPSLFVEAAARALETWESELEGLVRFRRVETPSDARLSVVLSGSRAPEPDRVHRVLGSTQLGGSCRSRGWDPDAERLRVDFDVEQVRIYVADGFGLLEPEQVEWVALHEIGHALGMRLHSPIPADLMHDIARVPVHTSGLSVEDINSFVTLYSLPNGCVFGHVPPDGSAPPAIPVPPMGAPQLARGPYVDPIRGFELRVPDGWLAMQTAQGMVAVDGVTWDYAASFQIVVQRFATIDAYLDRYAAYYRSRGRIRWGGKLVVNGRRAIQVVIDTHDRNFSEEVTVIELGDGRVMVVTADAPRESLHNYQPWFRAALGSLEIWSDPGKPDAVARPTGDSGRSGR